MIFREPTRPHRFIPNYSAAERNSNMTYQTVSLGPCSSADLRQQLLKERDDFFKHAKEGRKKGGLSAAITEHLRRIRDQQNGVMTAMDRKSLDRAIEAQLAEVKRKR